MLSQLLRSGSSMFTGRRSLAFIVCANFFLAAAYFVAGKLGLRLAFVNISASSVWPPTGIALAACILWGHGVCPGIFAGAFLVNITTQGSAATCLGIAAGNTLEALVGAFLITRFADGARAFDRPRNIFRFALLGAGLSTMVSATVGVLSLCLGGAESWNAFLPVWLTWWLGDAVAALVLTPPLVLWATQPRIDWSHREVASTLVFVIALLAVGDSVFGWLYTAVGPRYPMFFLCLPIVVWSAFQLQQRGTATAMLVLSAIAIWGTLRGVGPFISNAPEMTKRAHEVLLLLQGFMGVTSITALTLAAVVSQRNRIDRQLRDSHDQLERRIRERTADLARSNEALREEMALHARAQEKLRQAERLSTIGDTMRGLAHESRNALQQSQACLELLALKSRDRPEIQELVADIQKGLDHLLKLYEEVRSYAAPIQLTPECSDLGELLQSAWQDVIVKHQERTTRLEQHADGVNLQAAIDRHALNQVFCHVLENSLSAGKGPALIHVTWSEVTKNGAPALQLRLRDNGPGLSPEARQRLFQPFFTTKTRGTGLGLAIARRIIDAHNGEIAVNADVADGTEIVIILPRKSP